MQLEVVAYNLKHYRHGISLTVLLIKKVYMGRLTLSLSNNIYHFRENLRVIISIGSIIRSEVLLRSYDTEAFGKS